MHGQNRTVLRVSALKGDPGLSSKTKWGKIHKRKLWKLWIYKRSICGRIEVNGGGFLIR
jgi:hypothetical protein